MIVPIVLAVGLLGVVLYKKYGAPKLPKASEMRGAILQGIEQNPPASTLEFPPFDSWVSLTIDGEEYLVSPTYLAPIGIGEAVEIAKENGLVLPTPRMVDEIYKAATIKVAPNPQAHDGTLSGMNARGLADKQAAHIESQIDGRTGLVAGTHKDVVFIDEAFGKAVNKPGIYGWHKLDGKPIQSPMWGHALAWKDYSQGLRGIKKV